jgi:hypothetical protein
MEYGRQPTAIREDWGLQRSVMSDVDEEKSRRQGGIVQ